MLRVVEVEAILVQRFGNIADTVLDPRSLWSHRDKSSFRTGCKHKLQVGSDDRSIGLALEPSLVRPDLVKSRHVQKVPVSGMVLVVYPYRQPSHRNLSSILRHQNYCSRMMGISSPFSTLHLLAYH